MKQLWFIFILILTLSSCAIEKITELVSDGREIKTPEWKVDYELPILRKQMSMSDMSDMSENTGFSIKALLEDLQKKQGGGEDNDNTNDKALIYMKLNPVEISAESLNIDSKVEELLGNKNPLTWPLPIDAFETPNIMETSFPSIKMDMDGDGTDDLELDRLQSRDGYLKIYAKVEITDSNGRTRDATKEEYFVDDLPVFNISKILISNKEFSFDEATYDEEKKQLVFIPKGFLSDWDSHLVPVQKESGSNDYVFKFELPENALSVRGKGFDFINNLIEKNTVQKSKSRSFISRSSRNIGDFPGGYTIENIKDLIEKNGGGLEGLEASIKNEEVSVKDIANAYQKTEDGDKGGIEDLLKDIGEDVTITDILSSETITENIEEFTELVKDYEIADGKTLGEVADSGNLAGLADFCKFHNSHAINGLKVTFSVEVNLGDSFIIVGRFINDFTAISMKESDMPELPLSSIGKILKEIKINADINNTFSFPIELRNAYLKGKNVTNVPILFNGKEGNFRLEPSVKKMYELSFPKPIVEIGDSKFLFDVVIPKGSECSIGLNTDFMIDMNIIAAGYASVETNSLGE